MEYFITQIPGWIVTAIAGFIGIGIGWGFVKAEVNHLKEGQQEHKIKIEALDSQKLNGGFKDDCGIFREQCKDDMKIKFDDIKFAINQNKETVTSQFNEIREFIGYVKRAIEEVNGRSK